MRIPKGLKTRLQSSLETLTPLEAGRLYVIYAAEAVKKKGRVSDYQPIKELWAALNARLDKTRGKPEEAKAVEEYNAVVFLVHLLEGVNDRYRSISIAHNADAHKVTTQVAILLQQDLTAEVIRRVKTELIDGSPKPVSIEDYDQVVAWAATDALELINEAANFIYNEVTDSGGSHFQTYFAAYLDRRIAGEDHDTSSVSPLGEEEDDRVFDSIYDTLIAKLEAGELVGGYGLAAPDQDVAVLIEDGTFPAWAALIRIWPGYVSSRGLRYYSQAAYRRDSSVMVARITDDKGTPIDAAALRKLAGDFYQDCRRRPWGKGLVEDPGDLDALALFLIQTTNALQRLKAPDWGRAVWEPFAKGEVDRNGDPYEREPLATVGSLNALDEDFRKGVTFDRVDFLREQFYPSSSIDMARSSLTTVFALLDMLDTTRQPFSFDRKEKGMLTMSELLGVKFATPLEKAVEDLRAARDINLSIAHAVKAVADRYFDGLDILLPGINEAFQDATENLRLTTENLNDWRARLKKWPYEIDVDDLDPGEPEVDEDFAKTILEEFLDEARRTSRVKNADEILFGKQGRLL